MAYCCCKNDVTLPHPAAVLTLPAARHRAASYESALMHRLERYDRETESYLYYGLSKSIATEQNWLWKLLPDVKLSLPPPEAGRDGERQAR